MANKNKRLQIQARQDKELDDLRSKLPAGVRVRRAGSQIKISSTDEAFNRWLFASFLTGSKKLPGHS